MLTFWPRRGGWWRVCLPTEQPLPDMARATILHRGPHSRIFEHPDSPELVTKLALSRSVPRDPLRRFFNCQARREFHSALRMKSIGLRVAEPVAWGYCLAPCSAFDSVFIARRLAARTSALQLLRTMQDKPRRQALWLETARQMARIYGNNLCHRDCHMENILVDPDNRLYWIDNDIRPAGDRRTLFVNLSKALNLMDKTTRKYRFPGEWALFKQALRTELAQTAHTQTVRP